MIFIGWVDGTMPLQTEKVGKYITIKPKVSVERVITRLSKEFKKLDVFYLLLNKREEFFTSLLLRSKTS